MIHISYGREPILRIYQLQSMSISIVFQKWVNDHGVCSGIYQACCEIDQNKTQLITQTWKFPLLLIDHNHFLFGEDLATVQS